jgi:hypothetical protein
LNVRAFHLLLLLLLLLHQIWDVTKLKRTRTMAGHRQQFTKHVDDVHIFWCAAAAAAPDLGRNQAQAYAHHGRPPSAVHKTC